MKPVKYQFNNGKTKPNLKFNLETAKLNKMDQNQEIVEQNNNGIEQGVKLKK